MSDTMPKHGRVRNLCGKLLRNYPVFGPVEVSKVPPPLAGGG